MRRLVLLAALLGGCSNPPSARDAGPCTPGDKVACVGSDGCVGVATCNGDGKSIGACQCHADMATVADMSLGPDMAIGADMTSIADMVIGADMQPPVVVTINPSETTVAAGGSTLLVATVGGSASQGVFFSVREGTAGGIVGSDGRYTAPAALGDYHVVATSVADPRRSATCLVHVVAAVPVHVSISPTSATLNKGQSQRFTTTVTGSANKGVWFSVTESGGGTIGSDGVYTAPQTLGTYHVVATSMADPTKSASATITVTATTQVAVSLSPPYVQLATQGTQSYNASVTGSGTNTVTWTVSGGGVSTSGPSTSTNYTAPNFAGTYTITATSVADTSKSATATIFVPTVDVTGTIAYSGSSTGRIYVRLSKQNERFASAGTSLAAPGPFTIRNVEDGTYTLTAWMDTIGSSKPSVAEPFVSMPSFVVSGATSAGTVTLVDPTPASIAATKVNGALLGDSSVIPIYNPITDGSHNEVVDHYKAYCSTNANPKMGSPVTRTVPAGVSMIPIDGLTNGTMLYCGVAGIANGTEGPLSNVVGPYPVGPLSGFHKLTGTVGLPVGISGPLYVVAVSFGANWGGMAYFANPVGPQSFTISGLKDGVYEIMAFIDRGDDGYIGPADPSTAGGGQPRILGTVAGADGTIPAFSIASAGAVAHVQTMLQQSAYTVSLRIDSVTAQPVAVTLVSGVNVSTPWDIAPDNQGGGPGEVGWYASFSPPVTPVVGDDFTFSVTFADGSQMLLDAPVNGVFTAPPTPTAPTAGTIAIPSTFSWTAPASAPGPYTYFIQLQQNGAGRVWELDDLSSSVTTLPYGGTPLVGSTTYDWTLSAQDLNGNGASVDTVFTTQ